MPLIEPQVIEFNSFGEIATPTAGILAVSLIKVPRGSRGTLLGVFGSAIVTDAIENGHVNIRLIPNVSTVLIAPLALLVAQVGVLVAGTPANQFSAAPQVTFDRVFLTSGRGVSILSTGARSNLELGWAFTVQTSAASSIVVTVAAVYEFILEWIASGPTPAWQTYHDEESESEEESGDV